MWLTPGSEPGGWRERVRSKETRPRRLLRTVIKGFGARGFVWRRGIDESGAELVEMAFVLPLLLTLLIGIFWIGRAINVYTTITRAAREGARYAVLPSSVASGNSYLDTLSSSCSNNTNVFNDYIVPALTADSLDPNNVKNYCQKAAWLESSYPRPCGVVISFSYPVKLAIPFTPVNATTIDIGTQVQMRLENQPTSGSCP